MATIERTAELIQEVRRELAGQDSPELLQEYDALLRAAARMLDVEDLVPAPVWRKRARRLERGLSPADRDSIEHALADRGLLLDVER